MCSAEISAQYSCPFISRSQFHSVCVCVFFHLLRSLVCSIFFWLDCFALTFGTSYDSNDLLFRFSWHFLRFCLCIWLKLPGCIINPFTVFVIHKFCTSYILKCVRIERLHSRNSLLFFPFVSPLTFFFDVFFLSFVLYTDKNATIMCMLWLALSTQMIFGSYTIINFNDCVVHTHSRCLLWTHHKSHKINAHFHRFIFAWVTFLFAQSEMCWTIYLTKIETKKTERSVSLRRLYN